MSEELARRDLTPDDAEEWTLSLGQVFAGGYRQIALARKLGVPSLLGLSTEEWVEQRLGGYVRMSISDRREAVAELSEEGMSTREIGEVLGVDGATVHRDQHAAVADATDIAEERRDDAELESPAVADATAAPKKPKPTADERRVDHEKRFAQLASDLAERVSEGLITLQEAEKIAAERLERVAAWVARIRDALAVLGPMVGALVGDLPPRIDQKAA